MTHELLPVMNFFFHTYTKNYSSRLAIPKFRNDGRQAILMTLFSARIVNERWVVKEEVCEDNDNWWIVDANENNKDNIYFIATLDQAQLITEGNKLIDLNAFTNTGPSFRANLQIKTRSGAFSSYQVEYPFRMLNKTGSIYSDCSMLTDGNAKKVGCFVRNISSSPIISEHKFYLYSNSHKKLLSTFKLRLNSTNFIDLTLWKGELKSSFIFAEKMLGIPMYVCEYEDRNLSFEHTHPPYEVIQGSESRELVKKFKDRAYEKVYTALMDI